MAELLSIVNNYVGKYKIEDLINNNIAIRTPTLESFISVRNKIRKKYKNIETMVDDCYSINKDETCININNSKNTMMYGNINIYKRYKYIIIEEEDILFE